MSEAVNWLMLVFRWLLVAVAAVVAYVVAAAVVALATQSFGGGGKGSYTFTVGLAAYAAIMAGIIVAPKPYRRQAMIAIVSIIMVAEVTDLAWSLISQTYVWQVGANLAGSFFACFAAYKARGVLGSSSTRDRRNALPV